jgi:hypothetical protein
MPTAKKTTAKKTVAELEFTPEPEPELELPAQAPEQSPEDVLVRKLSRRHGLSPKQIRDIRAATAE